MQTQLRAIRTESKGKSASTDELQSCSNPERGLHPPLSVSAKTHKVSHSRKLLCQSPQEQLPDGGITSAYRQKCSEISTKQNIPELFQPTIVSPKAKQQMETYIGSKQSESLPQGGEIQNGDTGNHQDIPPTRGVGHLNRFQGRLLPYTYTGTFHVQGQTYQFKALPFGLSTAPLEFTVIAKVKLMPILKGIRIHQYLDDWLVRATSHRVCLQHTQDLVRICQELGWLMNWNPSRCSTFFVVTSSTSRPVGSDPHWTGGRTFRTKY